MLVFLLAGCTQFAPLDQRGTTVNQSGGHYAKKATLLDSLGGFRIVSLHLAPAARSVGAAAVDPADGCHFVQLPNGPYVIVCN
jgi:hypothetical protein